MDFRNRKLVRTVQIIFGIVLIIFALNLLFQFMPGPQFGDDGNNFLGALAASGYIFQVMALIWIVGGLFFILDKFSPLGAVIIFPISLNIILFHLFFNEFASIPVGLIIFLVNIYLLYVHWNIYRPMFRM